MTHNLLYNSKFVKHEYNTDDQTLYTEWFIETENMNTTDFKHEVLHWGEVSKQVPLSYIFDYCCNFLYTITPEEQIWMAHQLNPIWSVAQVKKYAHIVPKEFISNLTVEQLFDEFFAMNLSHQFELKHFADNRTEEASRWLLNSSNI